MSPEERSGLALRTAQVDGECYVNLEELIVFLDMHAATGCPHVGYVADSLYESHELWKIEWGLLNE